MTKLDTEEIRKLISTGAINYKPALIRALDNIDKLQQHIAVLEEKILNYTIPELNNSQKFDPVMLAIRIALVHGETLTWIGQNILGGVSRQRAEQVIKRFEMQSIRRIAKEARALTRYYSLKSSGLFYCVICKCFFSCDMPRHRSNHCRNCYNKHQREYIHRTGKRYYNPDVSRRARIRWAEKNKEKIKEYRQTYNEEHREEIRTRCRDYYRKHLDEFKARYKAYHESNIEQLRVKGRVYYKQHRDEILERLRAKRASGDNGNNPCQFEADPQTQEPL
jgi:hypothetical protein